MIVIKPTQNEAWTRVEMVILRRLARCSFRKGKYVEARAGGRGRGGEGGGGGVHLLGETLSIADNDLSEVAENVAALRIERPGLEVHQTSAVHAMFRSSVNCLNPYSVCTLPPNSSLWVHLSMMYMPMQ